jgi:hypothetical protein
MRRHYMLLAKTMMLLARFRLALLFSSYEAIAKSIRLTVPGRSALPPAVLLAWATRQAARVVPGATCLTQALTLQFLLAQQGETGIIRVGVKQETSGAIDAHAWVLHEDRVLLGGSDRNLSEYRQIADLKPKGA